MHEFSLDNHLNALKKMNESGAQIHEKDKPAFISGLYKMLVEVQETITNKQVANLQYYFNQNHKSFNFKDPFFVMFIEKLDEIIIQRLDQLTNEEFNLVFYFGARSKRKNQLSRYLSNWIERKFETLDFKILCEFLSSMRIQKDYFKQLIDRIFMHGLQHPEKIRDLPPDSFVILLFCLSKNIGDEQLLNDVLIICAQNMDRINLSELSCKNSAKLLHALASPFILKHADQRLLDEVRKVAMAGIATQNEDFLTAASSLYGTNCLNDEEVCQLILKYTFEILHKTEFSKLLFILLALPKAESGQALELLNYIMYRTKENLDRSTNQFGRNKVTMIFKSIKTLISIINRGYEIPNNIMFAALNSFKPEAIVAGKITASEDFVTLAQVLHQFVESLGDYTVNFHTLCIAIAKKYVEGFFLQDKTFATLARQSAILEVLMRSPQLTEDGRMMKRILNLSLIYLPMHLQQLIDKSITELDESCLAFLQLLQQNKEHLPEANKSLKDAKKYFKQQPAFLDSISDPKLREFCAKL